MDRYGILIFAVLMLVACGPTHTDHYHYDDDHEEDDSRSEALWQAPLHEGVHFSGYAGDPDYHRIEVDHGFNAIEVFLEFDHTYGDLDLLLLDEYGDIVTQATSADNDEYLAATLAHSGGTYYLLVEPYAYSFGNDYVLHWHGHAESGFDDSHEEDDDLDQADRRSALLEQDPFDGIARDRDYHRITVSDGYELVDVYLTFDDGSNDLDLFLIDSDGAILDSSEGFGASESIVYEVPYGGTYYLLVRPQELGEAVAYTLSWDDLLPDLPMADG